MNYSAEKNNKVYIMGEIVSDAVFSHEVYGEGFYEFFVRVMRLSGAGGHFADHRFGTADSGLCVGERLCNLRLGAVQKL